MAIYIGNQKVSVKGGLPVEVIEEVGEQVDFTLANATESDVLSGKTFYAQNKTLKMGTLEMPSIGENKFAKLVDGTITEVTAKDLEGITSIGPYSFYFRKDMQKITIPKSITKIGDEVFYYCRGLTTVQYEGTIDDWVGITFNGANSNPIYGANNSEISLLINNEIVTKVEIMKATEIKANAFARYAKLTNIVIGDNVTSIGYQAFAYIGSSTNKATLRIYGSNPPTIQSSTFNAAKIEKIIVDAGTLSIWQNATNWSTYADKMEEATE